LPSTSFEALGKNFQKKIVYSLPSARLDALGKEGVKAANCRDRRFSLPNAA
jgi:hypothetical protein